MNYQRLYKKRQTCCNWLYLKTLANVKTPTAKKNHCHFNNTQLCATEAIISYCVKYYHYIGLPSLLTCTSFSENWGKCRVFGEEAQKLSGIKVFLTYYINTVTNQKSAHFSILGK